MTTEKPEPGIATDDVAQRLADNYRQSTDDIIIGPLRVTYDENAQRESDTADLSLYAGNPNVPAPEGIFDALRASITEISDE